MIGVDNPLGQDPIDFYDETAASRIGNRIRTIRVEKGMSQAELGNLVGLTADRIQKYENGADGGVVVGHELDVVLIHPFLR